LEGSVRTDPPQDFENDQGSPDRIAHDDIKIACLLTARPEDFDARLDAYASESLPKCRSGRA
jgi:hypothetical protein